MASTLTVTKVFAAHTLSYPGCPPLDKHSLSLAHEDNGTRVAYIFSRSALNVGETVDFSDLTSVHAAGVDCNYYLLKEGSSVSTVGSKRSSPSPDGYKPDTFKSPDEIRNITRGMF